MDIKKILKHIYALASFIRFAPIIMLSLLSQNWDVIKYDIKRWGKCYGLDLGGGYLFLWLLVFYREFRSIVYYRSKFTRIFKLIAPPMANLYIYCDKIGKGIFIQHGFSTVISAKSIGENCWINQQVTIGYTNGHDAPVIGNNVKIYAGAIIIGNVKIGDNAVIGAGTVVVKDVPDNTTIVGAPSRIIDRKSTL